MRLRTREIGSSSDPKGKGKAIYQESSEEEEEEEEEEEYFPVITDSDYEVGEELLDAHEENGEREAIEVSDSEQDNVPTKKRKRKSSKRKREQSGIIIHDELGEEDERGMEENAEILDALKEMPVKKKGKKKKADKPVLMWQVLEQENNRWVAENLENDLDLVNQNEMIAETAEAPADLIIPLLRYQKEWLAWALKQESSVARGGILADEMGMGKTLQAIALVLLKRTIPREICGSTSATSSNILPSIKGTLVICPMVAAMQWESEIEKFTLEGSTKVLVYHGANRAKKHYQFSEFDFVITTYSIVEAEYRKFILPPKAKCKYCGKSFQDHKLRIHLKYYCGPDAMRTLKQSKQVKKKSNMKELVDPESSTKTASSRKGKKHKNADNDENEHDSFEGKSILHSFMWERIILDEAHYIKDRRSSTTRSIFALQSSYKWALSGTPLQNRVGELYSLIRFLRIDPYSCYFCKDCDCRVLDYSATADCPGCAHKSVRHFCWWNRYISTPIQDSGHAGGGRAAMLLLKHKVLKSIVLRRTKKGRAADLALPPRAVTLRRDSLDVVEEDYYTALYNDTQSQFNTYIEQGTVLNNYAHIFDLLTRLRQAVDHPYLVEYSLLSVEKRRFKQLPEEVGKQVCKLCHEAEDDTVVTSCGHIFCKSCLIDFGVMSGQNICPECSKPLTVDFSTNIDVKKDLPKTTLKGFRPSSILNRIVLADFQTSTKIDALREEIRFMIENDGSAKGIVFSQFSSFLDLIHYSLEKSGVTCVKLDGSMSMSAREVAIKRFSMDSSCKIFLMSLKAGGVALNLTVASHVFLMDPWWNPAVERQAQDRIHRIGQYKSIQIVRFIIQNTIEERILKLQEKKELVFEGTIGGSSEAFSKLTEADLRFLFQ